MRSVVTAEDEGKRVVRGDETVGRVVEVQHGIVHVDPDPGLGETLLARLGWADRDEDTSPLREDAIRTVTDDEVRLKRQL
jgi:hypothetical protein